MNFTCKVVIAGMVFLLTGCFSTDDDGLGRSLQLETHDAFTFDNEKTYAVGDTIFFNQTLSRYVKEEGFSELVDIYESTNSEEFGYSFELLKFSDFSNNYSSIFIDERFILAPKPQSTNFFYYGFGIAAILNSERDAYESRVGLILVETGKFKLDLENIRFANGYDTNEIHIDIYHSFTETSQLDFEFEVVDE